MEISKIKMIPLTAIRAHVTNGDPMRGMVSLIGIMIHLVGRLYLQSNIKGAGALKILPLLYFPIACENINKVNPVFFMRDYGILRSGRFADDKIRQESSSYLPAVFAIMMIRIE
jgi:hypothetical protein